MIEDQYSRLLLLFFIYDSTQTIYVSVYLLFILNQTHKK